MLRVGTVPYLVARPLDGGLEHEPGLSLDYEVPARLVQGLREGRLDVALVSSIELFRGDGYRYLDGWAVAGQGRVSSVQVFLRRDLEQVRRLALDPASRAAAALTQVVWPGERPEFLEVPEDQDPRAVPADAWLRIGDQALVETFDPNHQAIFNPSQRWTEQTGHPMPFAVWVVAPHADPEPLLEAFARAERQGRDRREEWAGLTSERLGIPLEASRTYFLREMEYNLGPRLGPALRAYRDAAAALGLARGDLDPTGIVTPASSEEDIHA